MTDSTRQADLLDEFLDTVLREPRAKAPQELDQDTAHLARAVALLERGVAPDPRVQDRVWQRTLAVARAEEAAPPRTRGMRVFAGLRPAHLVGMAAALLLVLGVGLWTSPGVRAHMERLLCFVPGLGIRACEPTALVATAPASAFRDGATLTVQNVLSAGGETTVQVEITGLPSSPSLSPQAVRLALRDERGKTYPPAPRAWSMGGGSRGAAGGPQRFRAEAVFVRLDDDVRMAEVLVDGPAPLGSWQLRVPLTPVQEAGLPTAREAQASVSMHGIAVRVASVLADRERTVVQLIATAEPPFRFVRGLGGLRFERHLVLRDDQGHEYTELRGPGRTSPDQGGVHTDDVLFPPLAADARAAEMVVPFVVVAEHTEETKLIVSIGGKQVGDSVPLDTALSLGSYSVVAKDAAIIEQQSGQRMLAMRLDLGDWREGRKLFGLERVLLDGLDSGYQFLPTDPASRVTEVRVALPENHGNQVTVAFRNVQVAVEGPWRLPVPVPASQ